MAIVELRNVWKRYADTNAVEDFNLTTNDGEFVVLVGPSGCGKTTTMRMIAGLEVISEGHVRIGERDVSDVAPKERDIAMVFQNYALYPHMSVYENMAFGLRLRKWDKNRIDEQIQGTAETLGIRKLLQRKPKELSGGQRQRVALGRAIVRQPQVFLMDEPLSNLDAKLRVEMRAEISKLCRRLNVTTFYVTHDQVEAMTMGQRIVVMRDGKIQQIDTPQNLYDVPANRFVAGFIGSPAMNFFPARVANRGAAMVGTGFEFPLHDAFANALEPHADEEVWAGIRPEHLHPAGTETKAQSGHVTGAIELIETLGSLILVQLRVGEQIVTAQFERDSSLEVGQELTLAPRKNQVHAFNRQSDRSLLESGGG